MSKNTEEKLNDICPGLHLSQRQTLARYIDRIREEERKNIVKIVERWMETSKPSDAENLFYELKRWLSPSKAGEKKRVEEAYHQGQEEMKKAFGGCEKCYGKGYATQKHHYASSKDFGDEKVETWEGNPIQLCDCERGKQMQEVLHTVRQEERQRIREWVARAQSNKSGKEGWEFEKGERFMQVKILQIFSSKDEEN